MKKKKENNYAFVDSQNLNLGVKSQGWNLNFARFRHFLKDKYQVNKAYLFIGYVKAGYICVFRPTLEIKDKGKIRIKGNVDAEGDGDFYCLIEYLVKQNKLRKIIVPNTRFSSLLRKFSKFIVNIQLFKPKLTK